MKNKQNTTNIPTIFVILGATGDLMTKKIAPSLFHLFDKKELPQMFKIIGFSRQDFSLQGFKDYVLKIITQHRDIRPIKEKLASFLRLFSYQAGLFENEKDYQNLGKILKQIDDKWGICSNKLFYLAVPPKFYKTIFKNLAVSGLTKPCSPEEGWTRIIVEKPFGNDLKTAKELDELLGKLFREEQIYRIDHYLAKEMLQNILAFRFSNNLFEKNWNNQGIESIRIKLLESIGVEDRGAFYDSVGALRDVGQNHLLQMLALITMDYPAAPPKNLKSGINFDAAVIRKKRAEILKTLKNPSKKEIKSFTFRAQYEGYGQIQGVAPNSQTETYFKIQAFLKSPRWKEIPITLESGKKLAEQRKEIIVTFKHPRPCLCPPEKHYKNKITFHLEPQEGITIQFWAKKPGLKMEIEEQTFEFIYRQASKKSQYTEEYEKLLLDCIIGDQMLFVSTEEVREMWRFTDPIIKAWQENIVPLKIYPVRKQPLTPF